MTSKEQNSRVGSGEWSQFIDTIDFSPKNLDQLLQNKYVIYELIKAHLENKTLTTEQYQLTTKILEKNNQKQACSWETGSRLGKILGLIYYYLQLNPLAEKDFIEKFINNKNFLSIATENPEKIIQFLEHNFNVTSFKKKDENISRNDWLVDVLYEMDNIFNNHPKKIKAVLQLISEFNSIKSYYSTPVGAKDLLAVIEKFSNIKPPEFLHDLTLVRQHQTLYPRIEQLSALRRILVSPEKHNPLLLGETGTGKTSLVESFCQEIQKEQEKKQHKNQIKVFSLDVDKLLSSNNNQNYSFEKNWAELEAFLTVVPTDTIYILFVDEIQRILGSNVEKIHDFSNRLKTLLNNPSVRIIGAMTDQEHGAIANSDAAILRRFSELRLGEPDENTILNILNAKLKSLWNYSLDEKAQKHLLRLIKKNYSLFGGINFLDTAIELSSKIVNLYIEDHQEYNGGEIDHVALIKLIKQHGLDISQKFDQASFVEFTKEIIIGQKHVLGSLSKIFEVFRANLHDYERPMATAFFAGPTGVGKTETAAALASYFYRLSHPQSRKKVSSEELPLAKINCETLNQEFGVSSLTGAPPGYVGYNETPNWVKKIQNLGQNGPVVLLFDEIEKANPEVLNSILGLLDNGTFRLSNGQIITLRNAVIICTSNILTEPVADEKLKSTLIKMGLKPEFVNRFDLTLQFNYLSQDNMAEITRKKEFKELLENLFNNLDIDVQFIDSQLINKFIEEYLKTAKIDFGARDLKRFFKEKITTPIAEIVNQKKLIEDAHVDEAAFILKFDFDQEGSIRPLLFRINKNILNALKNHLFKKMLSKLELENQITIHFNNNNIDKVLTNILLKIVDKDASKANELKELYFKISKFVEKIVTTAIRQNSEEKSFAILTNNNGEIVCASVEELKRIKQSL